VDPAKVVILGGGVVGSHACHIALGMGAKSGCSTQRKRCARCGGNSDGRSTPFLDPTRSKPRPAADLVIGGVLIPGASAPKLAFRPRSSSA
jgi:alanine dehydrogenase